MPFSDLPLKGSYSASEDRLSQFYVPLLSQAVAYDRVTGYFRSSSLVRVAAGLSRFLANGGVMRLIAGADFSDDDVRAVEDGEPLAEVLARRLLEEPLEAEDIVSEHRLATLAWLVRERRLHIKVGVPVDHLGRALRRDQTDRYFHSKYGVLTDAATNRVAFEGSNNETSSGMGANHEGFSVFPSWIPAVWEWNGQPVVDRFTAHWDGSPDLGWSVFDLPDAVAEHLVARVKDKPSPPPSKDPEEVVPPDPVGDLQRLAALRDAPRKDGGTGVGFATCGVEPWPHQLAIARRAVNTYPRSYLLADEVGLGKTIEFGLILRELLVSGNAESALLLVPASVIRQWQEELDEKMALVVPRLDAGRFWTRDDEEITWSKTNPWRAFPIVLASSHLARRRDRQDEIIAAGPWDVVFVDEAHHARRSGSKPRDTPNTLLTLLQRMKANSSWKALYLASATPMQMNAHEAWDLLELLALTGGWGESAERFVRYYTELREAFDGRQWEFLRRMSADFFADPQTVADPVLTRLIRENLGLTGSNPVRRFHDQGLTNDAAREMGGETRRWMDEWLRANTPMRERVFRTTRQTLREYKANGLLAPGSVVPVREVRDRFVAMRPDEQQLYNRVEAYITGHYDAFMADARSKPLGFIMTVYRRRLTSSFLAIERSLHRRRDAILGKASALLDADDIAALEYSGLADTAEMGANSKALAEELSELTSFLADLAKRPPDESKMERLNVELNEAFRGPHDTAIVFTQYTDTMDYLRDQLNHSYPGKVVCYSGRGGERWNQQAGTWEPVTKAEVKRLFREGRDVKILIGTDSLSEGLNLQTCGFLVNYDMPWNMMRVEQRIGRVDRINGQPVVEIRNYFYEDTVEEKVYRGIAEDFDWFTDIVGPAQPVLSTVEAVIEHVAMLQPGAARDAAVLDRIAEIREAIVKAKARAVSLSDLGGAPSPADEFEPAIDLPEIERTLLGVAATATRFDRHPSVPGAYLLDVDGQKVPVTFRRNVLDQWAPEVRLLTYGNPLLERLLNLVGVSVTPVSDSGPDDSPGPWSTIEAQTGRLPYGDTL